MGTKEAQGADACRLVLDGDLSIYRARELKDALRDILTRCKEVVVDLSGVEDIDTAGVQVLIFAKRRAGAEGGNLRLTGHSRAVLELLDLYDLGWYFGDPVVLQPAA